MGMGLGREGQLQVNNCHEPSQTRRWSRLKPIVMVVDKKQDNSVEIGAYLKPKGF